MSFFSSKTQPPRVSAGRLTASAVLIGFGLVSTACVTSRVTRTGRVDLSGGAERYAPVLAEVGPSFREVALIAVDARVAKNEARTLRHLRRKAGRMGCDAITGVRHLGDGHSTAICVERWEPVVSEAPPSPSPATISDALIHRAAASGAPGLALVSILKQAQRASGEARTWPLQWYLDHYPSSPFRAEVESILRGATDIATATEGVATLGAR